MTVVYFASRVALNEWQQGVYAMLTTPYNMEGQSTARVGEEFVAVAVENFGEHCTLNFFPLLLSF